MKTMLKTLLAVMFVFAAVLAGHAQLLFSDDFNYPNGCVETDGVWFCYSPATPGSNTFVNNKLLVFTQGSDQDSVAAPFTNNSGNTLVLSSFTINVSQLPTSVNGSYFAVLMQDSNQVDVADVGHVFIDTKDTVVPGTYRLGIANFATSLTTAYTTNYPLDLATGITYHVVFSYDPNSTDPLTGATLWINPSSQNDFNVYANDIDPSTAQADISTNISAVGFSPYVSAAIGDVMVGLDFTDVMTNVAELPVIGVEPQGTTAPIYSGNNLTLYTAASGMDVTYQWYSNNVALADNGVSVVGSQSNVLYLTNLQASANYNVIVTDSAGSTTSLVAQVSVNSTPTPLTFTTSPVGATNAEGSTITLTAVANGTGPISYQWYFEQPSGSYSPVSGATGPTLTLTDAGYNNSGLYYVMATGGDGSPVNSASVPVLVIPPPLVSIAYLHSFMTGSDSSYDIDGTSVFNIQGVVTTFAPFSTSTKTYGEYYIEDNSGEGIYVYVGSQGTNSVPPPGTMVSVIGPVQVYDSQLEIDPTVSNASNSVSVVSYNNPVPAPQVINYSNFMTLATNSLGAYGLQMQDTLVTLTNVYVYSSKTGGAVTGNFSSNSTATFYVTPQPYVAGLTNLEMYISADNGEATNFWYNPKPSGHAYEITGILGEYEGIVNFYPTRYLDIVTSLPTNFPVAIANTNGISTLNWPTVAGSTYSLYSATNLLGPWTQTFGLGYYPSIGTYTDTNPAAMKFYRVSTP
jgi:hypothetical protein